MIKPILFNAEMVRAITEGRKTVTRRIVRQSVYENFVYERGKVVNYLDKKRNILESPLYKAPYQPGDILYVREKWCENPNYKEFYYAAKRAPGVSAPDGLKWRPSIHMPKEAARIWLKVTDVKVERLHTMTLDDYLNEGVSVRQEAFNDPENAYLQAKEEFTAIWDGTIKHENREIYGWDANPWTWVITFKRCKKPAECNC